MNEEAREAINRSIVVIADVLYVNTRSRPKAPGYTAEEIVSYARAMAMLASCLTFDKADVAELEKGE